MERLYFGQVCLVSWWFPVPEWAILSPDLGNFLLLFCWIHCIFLWLMPLLLPQCTWFSGLVCWWSLWFLVYSFHSSWVDWQRFLLCFSLISISSLSSEILSSTYSSLLEWLSAMLFIWLRGLFISRISAWFFFFWGFTYLCSTPLSYVVLSSLFHLSLFYSFLCFTLVFFEVLSEFI
jgi:hypothetical protein